MSKIAAISILGLGIVFGFLLLLYVVLSSFKYIFERKELKSKAEVSDDIDIVEEDIARIAAVLNYYGGDDLPEGKIVVNRVRGEEDEEIYCSDG